MQTIDRPSNPSGLDYSSSSHGGGRGSLPWFGGRRGVLIVSVLAVAFAAVAVLQNWVAFATLLPLLYLLPCAAMMYICMKGMKE